MPVIEGSSGPDTLIGTDMDDVIHGYDGDDVLRGGAGADHLLGGDGRDQLYGDAGDDVIDVGRGGDSLQVVDGGAGDDTYIYRRESGNLFFYNAAGSSNGSDRIAFSDLRLNEMTFSLHDYRSTPYSYLGLALQISWADVGTSHGEFRLAGDYSVVSVIEFADGSTVSRIEVDEDNPDAVIFYGTGGDDRIASSFQDDALHGGSGADWLDAGGTRGGTQYLFGGDGGDTYVYGRESGETVISGAAETATPGQTDRVVFTDLGIGDLVPRLVADPATPGGQQLVLEWNNESLRDVQADLILSNAADWLADISGAQPAELPGSTAVADATFTSVAAAIQGSPTGDSLRVNSFAQAGDGGGAFYVRVATEPDHAGKLQTANGVWWELAEPAIRPEMFGARANDGQDDLPGLQAAADAASALGAIFAGADGAVYSVSASWDIEQPLSLSGSWTIHTMPGFTSTATEGRAAERVVGFYAADIVQIDPFSRITIDAEHMREPTETWFSDPSTDYNPDAYLYVAAHGAGADRLDLSISVLNSAGGGVYITGSTDATLRNVYAENVQTVNEADMAVPDLLAVAPVFGFYDSVGARILGGYIADRTDKGFSFKESTDIRGEDLWTVGGHTGHASHYTNRVDGAVFVGGGQIGGSTAGHGVKIYDSDNVVVRGMQILDASVGISVEHSADVLVEDNLVLDPTQFGILVYSLIPEKFILDGATGHIHTHTDDVIVRGNTINVPLLWHSAGNSAREIATYTWGDRSNSYTRGLEVYDNTISVHGAGSLSIADQGRNIEQFQIGDLVFDSIRAGLQGEALLVGGSGADWLYAADGDQSLEGGSGDDRLHGGRGSDQLNGGDGVDTADYATDAGAIQVDLLAGAGRGNSAAGDRLSGIENLVGTAFGDVLAGDHGSNQLLGGDGDDTLVGRLGADILNGGAGLDTVSYAGDYGAVFINLATGQGRWNAGEGDRLVHVENLIGTDWGDRLVGDAGANRLEGGAGDDTLTGGAGDDVLVGGLGADLMGGDSGSDTIDYSGAFGAIWVDLAAGAGRWNHAEGDRFTSIENLTGTAWGDRLIGDGEANRLDGGDGDDTLAGGDGDDVLIGGAGDDVLTGGVGADVIGGGSGADRADYSAAYGAVSIDLASGLGRWNHAEGDRFTSIENLTGTAWGDRLSGDAQANRLDGGAGEDVLTGGAGDDVLTGGAGADLVDGGSGVDRADYSAAYGAIWIDLASGEGRWNHAEGDRLASIEDLTGTDWSDILAGDSVANRLAGGAGDDALMGGGGDDLLSGGLGDDRLIGGVGSDLLDGGSGADTADYSAAYGAISIDLAAGVGRWNHAEGDRLASIENLIGTAWGDRLTGDAAANILTGGGGNDTFIFDAGFNHDQITDFNGRGASTGDVIAFAAGLFTGFDEMMAHAVQVGSDVIITAAGDSLTLVGVLRSALDASDFDFGVASSAPSSAKAAEPGPEVLPSRDEGRSGLTFSSDCFVSNEVRDVAPLTLPPQADPFEAPVRPPVVHGWDLGGGSGQLSLILPDATPAGPGADDWWM